MYPEVGDLISLPKWNGRFYKVVRIEYDRVWVEFSSHITGDIRETHYDISNEWIIKRPLMEDTRGYLEALSI